ncbi:hypothetical protein HT031_002855 [Scenedesmus sp. PABB004]|nr:hypothetical protein HT031_002855 [Scenedesmus sp. PABB004]
MLSSGGAALLRRQLLASAGGALQHAAGLLGGAGAARADPGAVAGAGAPTGGRAISTTRGIAMGRLSITDNLVRGPPESSLYTRDNYAFLQKNGWSLAACEQVLSSHSDAKRARGGPRPDYVNRALNQRIGATTSLDELRAVLEEQAHAMTAINLAVFIQNVPRLLHTRTGQRDYAGAAVLLDHAAHLLAPAGVSRLSGPNLCSSLAAFTRCRYSPSAELVQAMCDELLAGGGAKLQRCSLASLAQLLLALSKLVHPQGQWPLMHAVAATATERLQALARGGEAGGGGGAAGGEAQPAAPHDDPARAGNSIALLAMLLARAQAPGHEFAAALHAWLARPGALDAVAPAGLTQLWHALRVQYAQHTRLGAEEGAAADGAGDGPAPLPAADPASAGDAAAFDAHAAQLGEFFGPATLPALAAATARRVPVMRAEELGRVLADAAALRFRDADLLAAAAAGMTALGGADGGVAPATRLSAAWAAAHLRAHDAALLQPALLAAVEAPGTLDGLSAGRLLRLTAALPPDVAAEQQALLRAECHARSGARGPAPAPPPPGGPPANWDWVDAVAADLAGRVGELKPRELAHALAAFAAIPGAVLHEGLFGAAAALIGARAHMFGQPRDAELIAAAFNALSYKDGLPALRALQEQAEAAAAAAGPGGGGGGSPTAAA